MANLPTQKEIDLRMSIADVTKRDYSPVQKTIRTIYGASNTPRNLGRPIIGGVAPFGAGFLSKGGSILKGAWTGGKSVYNVLNKFGNVPFKTKFLKFGGKVGAGALTYYGATGESPAVSLRGLATTTGFVINPVAGAVGFGAGTIKNVGDFVSKYINPKIPDKIPDLNIPNYAGGTQIVFPENIQGTLPAGSYGTGSVQFPVGGSINVGGGLGGGELSWILLALGLGGGYLLGKRRRKKKRYKKKRKR